VPFRTTRAARATRATRATRRTLIPATVAVATALAVAIPLGMASSAAAEPEPPTSRLASAVGDRSVDQDASFYLNIARGTVQTAVGKVDATGVETQITALSDAHRLPALSVAALTQVLRSQTGELAQAVDTHDAQAAAAAAAAAALAQANTPDGARATARAMAAQQYGWGDAQFSCLNSLWTKESGWNYQAYNRGGGATGIPQSLPGSKMAAFGADWQTNAATQIAWGLDYIKRGYGSPCAAWAHSRAVNWY
jgi:hypothetical protein